MKVCYECDVDQFEFWSGAKDRWLDATEDQREQVAERLEEYAAMSESVLTETEVNDIVWFECDDIFFGENEEE